MGARREVRVTQPPGRRIPCVRRCTCESGGGARLRPSLIRQQSLERTGESFRVVGIDEVGGASGDFGKCAPVRRDDGNASRHCLEYWQSEAFVERWEYEYAGPGV